MTGHIPPHKPHLPQDAFAAFLGEGIASFTPCVTEGQKSDAHQHLIPHMPGQDVRLTNG